MYESFLISRRFTERYLSCISESESEIGAACLRLQQVGVRKPREMDEQTGSSISVSLLQALGLNSAGTSEKYTVLPIFVCRLQPHAPAPILNWLRYGDYP